MRAVRPAFSTFRNASASSDAVRSRVPDRPDLEHHHAYRVRDHVAQLARVIRARSSAAAFRVADSRSPLGP